MEADTQQPEPPENAQNPKEPVASISGQVQHIPTGMRALLRRMDPDHPERALSAVIPVLQNVEVLAWQGLSDDGLRRWSRVCHLIAVLSGASARPAHVPNNQTGQAIHDAGYSEQRLMRLTSAKGPALTAQIIRLARYLAASDKVPLDLRPIATLILNDGWNEKKADEARLRIARGYYEAADRKEKEKSQANKTDKNKGDS